MAQRLFLQFLQAKITEFRLLFPEKQKSQQFSTVQKKPLKGDKECLLIFDQNTCQLRLEKLSANINVKKSRFFNILFVKKIEEFYEEFSVIRLNSTIAFE
uniref:Transcription elongation factor Eaf N-terminal domain-containing protein n=1 Tax=Meloidogyne incognita TaxID=6306 RepID=A0A914LMD2_MELIC